jgi:hypothetical protein
MKTYRETAGGGSDAIGPVAGRAFMDIATQIKGRRVQGGAH